MAIDNEFVLKLIADAKGLTSGLSEGEKSVQKLEQAIANLEKTTKELEQAEKNLAKAQQSGDEKAIKLAEKQLESKRKLAQTAQNTIDKQVQNTEKLLNAETRELGLIEKLEIKLKQLQESRKKATDPQQIEALNQEIEVLSNSIKDLGGSDGFAGIDKFNEGLSTTTSLAPEALQGIAGFADQLTNIAKTAGPLGIGFAVILGTLTGIISASTAVTKQTADYSKELQNLQRATGVSTSLIATLSEGLKRNGGDANDSADALLQLGQVITSAIADPTSEAARKFQDLNIAVQDASEQALGIEEVFRAIDKSAQGAGLSQDKLVTLAGILGEDSAKKVLPLIGSFASLEEQVKKTGLVLGQDTLEQANKLNAGLAEIESVFKGVAVTVGGEFLSAFNNVITQVKIAIDTLSNDEDLMLGFQALINLVKDFIGSAGPDLVTLVQGIIEFIGRLGIVVAVVAEGFGSLKESILGKTEATRIDIETTTLQSQVIGQATQQAAAQTAVIDGLKKKTEQLNQVQQANLAIQKNLTDLRIASLEIAKNKGLISEEEFSKQSLQLQVDTAKQSVEIANNLVKEKQKIADQERKVLGKVRTETELELKSAQAASIAATTELVKLQTELQTKPIKDALKEQLNTLQQTTNNFKNETLKQIQIIDEAEKNKTITHQTGAIKRLAISKSVFQQEIDGINEILKNANISAEDREQLENRRKALVLEIDKLTIEGSSKVRDARKADLESVLKVIEQERQFTQQRLAEIEKEDQLLKEKRKGQLQDLEIARKQNNAVADLAGTTEGFIERNKQLSNIITQIAKQFEFTFDPRNFDETNIDVAQKKLVEFQQILANTEKDLLVGSGSLNSLLLFQKELAIQSIEDITNKLSEASSRLQAENTRKQAEAEQEAQKKLNEELIELNKERLEKIGNLERDFREDNRKLNEDRTKENNDYLKESTNRLIKYNEDRNKLEEEYAKKESEIRERAAQEENKRIESLKIARENALNDAAKGIEKAKQSGLEEIVDLREKLTKVTDPKEIEKINAQINAIKKEGSKEEQTEKAKAAEISKALEESSSTEELEIRKKAIEDKYKQLEDENKTRLKIKQFGTAEELKQFEESINRVKELDEQRLKDSLDRLKKEQDLKRKQAEDEKNQRAKDFADKQKERENQFKQEQVDADLEHKQRLNKIEDQQKEIRARFKQTYDEINRQAIDSAKQIGATAKAVEDAFNIQDNAAKKYLSTLKQIKDAQGVLNPNNNTNSNNSNPTTNSSTQSNISNISNNPSSTNTNTSNTNDNPSTGTLSGNSTSGIVQQPAKDKSGNQQSGIGTPPKFGGEKPGDVSVPNGTAADAASYRKSAFEMLGKWEQSDKGDQIRNKLNKKLFDLTSEYIKAAKIDSFIADEILRNPPGVNYFKKADKNLQAFSNVIDSIIKKVEGLRKKEEPGKGKLPSDPGKINDVPTLDPSSTGGIGGNQPGNGSGDKGNDGFGPRGKAGIGENPTIDNTPKDTRFDPKKENIGEGAEAEGFQLSGPNFPTGQKPNINNSQSQQSGQVTVNSNPQIQKAINIENLTLMADGETLEKALLDLIQSGKIRSSLAEQVNSKNSQDNFSRNPGKRIVI